MKEVTILILDRYEIHILILLYSSLFFIALTTLRNHLLVRDINKYLKELKVPLSIEFGWLGLRITPVISAKGNPKRGPTDTDRDSTEQTKGT